MNHYFVYILTNNSDTLYIGVTNNLERRMYEHKNELVDGFTKRYQLKKLIYFEETSDINAAIAREKQLKRWSRDKKLNLIRAMNQELRDISLSESSFKISPPVLRQLADSESK